VLVILEGTILHLFTAPELQNKVQNNKKKVGRKSRVTKQNKPMFSCNTQYFEVEDIHKLKFSLVSCFSN